MSVKSAVRTDRVGNQVIGKALAQGDLTAGMSAEAVKYAERMLKLAGFNPGTMDKKFDAKTAAALKEFQAAVGLKPSGALDEPTFEKLKTVQARVRKHDDSFIGLGSKSGRIEDVEKRLARLGYDSGKADGVYDRKTAAAVKAFAADQKELKDGSGYNLGAKGQKVLADESKKLSHLPEHRRVKPDKKRDRLDRATAQNAAAVNPDGTRGLGAGQKGRAVANVQAHLRAAGFDPKSTGGLFDERTAGALKAFQRRAGLPVTGRVTPLTWKRLQKSMMAAKNGTSPAQYLGERSAAVKKTEKLLQKLGFKTGAVDGLFSKATEDAVKAFEDKAKGIKTDGKVDARDLKGLEKMVKEKAGGAGAKAIEVARKWLGFQEKGENGNPFSKSFGRPPEAWCADFVSYCFKKAGKPIGANGIAYVPYLMDYFKKNGSWSSKPAPGKVVIFNWDGGVPDHTGIVTAVRNGRVYTIEGNSGDAVRTKSYPIGSSVLQGYGTP